MLVLAINTSTKIGTVALYSSKTGLISEVNLNIKLNHSDTVMTSIDTLFALTGHNIKEVEKIAVSIGPGSFTGIRVGVGTAKGLAYSLGVPIVGINELDLIANMANNTDKTIISTIDARKERVYYASYRYVDGNIKRTSEYLDGELKDVISKFKGEDLLFLGDASIIYRDLIQSEDSNATFNIKSLSIPRASVLAEMAVDREEDSLVHLEPYYHSKTQAERMKEAKNN